MHLSSLGPALTNIFIYSFENKWVKDCHPGLKSEFCRWCFDNIIVFFPLSTKQKSLKSFDHSNKHNIFVRERKRWPRSFFRHQDFSWKKIVTSLYLKRPSVTYIRISIASYQKPINPVQFGHCCFKAFVWE